MTKTIDKRRPGVPQAAVGASTSAEHAEVLAHVRDLNRQHGLTILLVEQNTQRALEIAHRAYLLELGQVVREGAAAELAADHSLLDAYLGRGQAGQRATPAQLST